MPDRHRRSSPQPRPSRKAVLLAGGRPVLTSLRGRETHTGLEAPAVCTILHSEGRRTVPMREPRAGDAGGDRARLRGRHADGAATGHSEDTDARAARGGWRGDAQTPVPRRPHGAPAFGAAESPGGTCRGAAAWHGVTVACGTEGKPQGAARVWRGSPGLPKFTGLGLETPAQFLSLSETHLGDEGKRGRGETAAAHQPPSAGGGVPARVLGGGRNASPHGPSRQPCDGGTTVTAAPRMK